MSAPVIPGRYRLQLETLRIIGEGTGETGIRSVSRDIDGRGDCRADFFIAADCHIG